MSTGSPRPIIPVADRRLIFASFHNLAHPGIRASRRLISARVVWPHMAADIGAWYRECQLCQHAKVTKHALAVISPIPVPNRRFSHLHADLVGHLRASREGFKYILTVVDRSSRWLEAVPLKDMEASTCLSAFLHHWVSRFGVPLIVTTDRGRQFSSATWAAACQRLGIQHVMTTAYHPQSNRMVERTHRQLKNALRLRLAGPDWPSHLPWALLGLRAAPKEDSAVTSAELVFGAPLSLPGEPLSSTEPPVSSFVRRLQQAQPPLAKRPLTYAQAVASVPPALFTARFVNIRRGGVVPPLLPLYQGPYHVISRNNKFFSLEVSPCTEVVSMDRLEPHLSLPDVKRAQPPQQGRPPAATTSPSSS
jgi:transposase InsO family protein